MYVFGYSEIVSTKIKKPREYFVRLSKIYFHIRLYYALGTHSGVSPDHVDHGGPTLFSVISDLRISITLNVPKFWPLLTSNDI